MGSNESQNKCIVQENGRKEVKKMIDYYPAVVNLVEAYNRNNICMCDRHTAFRLMEKNFPDMTVRECRLILDRLYVDLFICGVDDFAF